MRDSFHQMTAARTAGRQADDRMQMQARLAVIAARDITDQAQSFALLVDGDRLVPFAVEIEPAELCAGECADRGDRRAAESVVFGKRRDRRERLIARIENQYVGSGTGVACDPLRFHRLLLAPSVARLFYRF